MSTSFLYNLGLLGHIVGLFFIAGGAFGAIVVERLLWQRLSAPAGPSPVALLSLLKQFPIAAQAGSLLMLLSGLLMLQQVQWSYWGQFWLMGKLVLYVMLLLNAILVARPLGQRLAKTLLQPALGGSALPAEAMSLPGALHSIRRRMYWFSLSQLVMLLLLFILSTFKPV